MVSSRKRAMKHSVSVTLKSVGARHNTPSDILSNGLNMLLKSIFDCRVALPFYM